MQAVQHLDPDSLSPLLIHAIEFSLQEDVPRDPSSGLLRYCHQRFLLVGVPALDNPSLSSSFRSSTTFILFNLASIVCDSCGVGCVAGAKIFELTVTKFLAGKEGKRERREREREEWCCVDCSLFLDCIELIHLLLMGGNSRKNKA